MVTAADVLRHPRSLDVLALQAMAETQAERIDRFSEDIGHQRGNQARVDATTDKCAKGDIGHQHTFDDVSPSQILGQTTLSPAAM